MPQKRQLQSLSLWDAATLTEACQAADYDVKPATLLLFYKLLLKEEWRCNKSGEDEQDEKKRGLGGTRLPDDQWLPEESWKRLPKKLRYVTQSRCNFALFTTEIRSAQTSEDDSTTKMLLTLQDGHDVEAVLMRHKGRNTLCVSSQVGCAMGCTFCATGTLKLKANLIAGEILEQLVLANRFAPIRNVVFMGMGEPLDNFSAVIESVDKMTHPELFGLARHRVSVSTVGVIPTIRELTKKAPKTTLCLSLHAPTQALREQIVPSAKAWKLPALMDAVLDYVHALPKLNRRVMMEYIMLGEVNDSDAVARQLGELLKPFEKQVQVNLIPYNATDVSFGYSCSSDERIKSFADVLIDEFNVFTTIRMHMGRDVDGACGQLALKAKAEKAEDRKGENKQPSLDIEDLLTKKPSKASTRRRVDVSMEKPTSSPSPFPTSSTTAMAAPSSSSYSSVPATSGPPSSSPAIEQNWVFKLTIVFFVALAILLARTGGYGL